jgi:hypothetical protein
MECPKCGLLNPGNSLKCDCGYNFETKAIACKSNSDTHKSDILHERNVFISVFVVLVSTNIILSFGRYTGLLSPGFEMSNNAIVFITLTAKLVFAFFIYRLSSKLKLKIHITILFCILSLFAWLYLIPFIYLLYKAGKANRNENIILPEKIQCPNCSAILELEHDERVNGRFICPECKKETIL